MLHGRRVVRNVDAPPLFPWPAATAAPAQHRPGHAKKFGDEVAGKFAFWDVDFGTQIGQSLIDEVWHNWLNHFVKRSCLNPQLAEKTGDFFGTTPFWLHRYCRIVDVLIFPRGQRTRRIPTRTNTQRLFVCLCNPVVANAADRHLNLYYWGFYTASFSLLLRQLSMQEMCPKDHRPEANLGW